MYSSSLYWTLEEEIPPCTCVILHHCTLGCEKRRITNIQNTLHYSFPHRYKESLRVWAANVSWAHLHVHKSSELDQDQAIGGQQSQRQPAAADTSFSFDLLGDEQAGNINKEKRLPKQKKGKKKQQTEMKVQQHEETNRVSVRITESLNVRIGPWISCCTKVLLENAKLCILKYYEDFKRIKYYLQQRSTVYILISPPFLFLLHPEKSPSGNHPPCCREVWRLRWPNTEGLISSVCPPSLALALVLSLYMWGVDRKTTRREEGKLPVTVSWSERKKLIYIEAKANETSHTMQKVRWRWMRRAPIVPALHSATMRAWVYITQHTS